jgi:hypothetical protein
MMADEVGGQASAETVADEERAAGLISVSCVFIGGARGEAVAVEHRFQAERLFGQGLDLAPVHRASLTHIFPNHPDELQLRLAQCQRCSSS